MTPEGDALGIIAGNRTLPLVLAREARRAGVAPLIAVAFEGETDPALAGLVDEIVWLKVGQLGKLITAFSERGVKRCVMAGQIAPKNLFSVRPDWRALNLLLRLKQKNAHALFGAIADALHQDGVELVPAIPWLQSVMPGPGFHWGPALRDAQQEDLAYGQRIAKEISRLDIGQTAVVKGGVVLAVEGFEGTDACLRRGGELAGPDGGAVAVKVAKAQHDLRFDLPCVGLRTLEVCAGSRIAVLAIESGKTLLLDQAEGEAYARQHRLAVTTV